MRNAVTSLLVAGAVLPVGLLAKVPDGYQGKPFQDENHQSGPARIPGVLQCALFDLGGPGVAYRDTTPANEGSGIMNHEADHRRSHASPYIWNFREAEGVDLNYVKDRDDLNHPQAVAPMLNQLYIGWTEEGEWTNYTVDVAAPGTYRVFALYSHQPTALFFDINGQRVAEGRLPRETGGWYSWDFQEVGKITFAEAGLQLLTFHFGKGSNFATLTFIKE